MPITKLLVANRGEVARRVFRTCRAMGIGTVAVYSDVDAHDPFVREADEAVPIGGDTPASSYLRGDVLVAAALRAGADAVHPGYGFLSENASFAQQCLDARLVWVGPPPSAIHAMGSKVAARDLMAGVGVPVLLGVDVSSLTGDKLTAAVESIRRPLLVKATFGGGGRGMRLVREGDDLDASVAAARREAASAFGDDSVFVERYLDRPRHIEVQVAADAQGNTVHLFERECSIQRRHQKIIEEAPSPFVDEDLRAAMGDAAVRAALAVGYVGAGTVEFLVSPSGEFFFLEMNTRLQVEHPVTEMITGLDLVQLQLLIAEGAPLPEEARHPVVRGHAIEARLYAEDPSDDYRPAPGPVHAFRVPPDAGARVDSGVEDGTVVSPFYDPMLAKVVAHENDRAAALRSLRWTLRNARIHGTRTNRHLLVAILEHPEFQAGDIDTGFLDRHPPADLVSARASRDELRLAAIAAVLAARASSARDASVLASVPAGWRNNRSQLQTRTYETAAITLTVGYAFDRAPRIEVDGEAVPCEVVQTSPDAVVLVVDGVRRRFEVSQIGDVVYVDSARSNVQLREVPRFPELDADLPTGSLIAPMPATVARVTVGAGERVAAGALLIVLEAMKMEHQIVAPVAGIVTAVHVAVGDAVDRGTVLAVLDEEGAS